MKALVYKSTGSWYNIRAENGQVYNSRIKGVFKIDDITSTNPVAVGDEVEIEIEDENDRVAIIINIHKRKNYIARTSPHQGRDRHIIASNIDQALLFATLKEPKTSQGFTDRFLLAAEAYHIPAIIVFNKADIYRNRELIIYEERKNMYTSVGYNVLLLSLQNEYGLDSVTAVLKDKVTLLSGHSGVGKSTFINAILPELQLRTKDVSGWSGKGMHTTTFAEMFDLPFGGKIIDTPGIREFGITDIEKEELSHYFPEMLKLLDKCQFNNCVHINEPGCAVKEAVAEGKIFPERYISYCNILESIEDKAY